ncbi:nucleoside hydrolase [Succinivibrio dextrinosolvens]|uniref:nucleoside hydrolase n=1 Tax=Succinivibrio dextrinosolvens TaxID=83771 RepID=UPI0004E28B16|nr:nucleoside hydrolase [Succinivibrio dextrinosolvens]
MEKIIIDTDIGVDDAIALRYGMLTCDVLGYTCSYGNVAVETAVKNCKLAMSKYGSNIPVFKGASRPLSRKPLPLSTHIHGKDGLGAYYDNHFDAEAPDAVHFIIEQARKYPGEVNLLTIGPMTNLALALNLCPELPKLLKRVISMGGAFGTDGNCGNMTQFAEFNIYNDPEAADLVFASELPLVVVPLDVTHRILITDKQIASTNDDFMVNISAFYIEFSKKFEKFAGMCVHDAQVVSYLLYPEKYKTIDTRIAVSTSGYTDGQTIRPMTDYNVPDDKFKGRPNHTVCLDVDVDFIRDSMLETLKMK